METKKEKYFNTLTHFVGLILSLIGIPILIYFNKNLTEFSLLSIIFFSLGLVLVYSSSTLYHYNSNPKMSHKLRVFDHISIFYLICGSYAPICLITLYNGIGVQIFITVFIMAVLGTLFKIFYTGKYEKASLFIYLAMGWLIVVDISSVFRLVEFYGILLLILSGIFYTVGTVFYSLKNIKFSHAIWHLFVLFGSACHYFVVLLFII